MKAFTDRLHEIFAELDRRIEILAKERVETGGLKIAKAEIRVLGQMSLLANTEVSSQIALAETADLDALLRTEYIVERELRRILKDHGFIYDESSNEIWIPAGARFEALFEFPNVVVTRIDPESALVSKAVKAKEKNKILLRQALASENFPGLAERIKNAGGDLEYFLEIEVPRS